jgi:hypothetical protein
MRGAGRAIAAATLLILAGIVNIIYGIGALGDANAFLGALAASFSISGPNPWWSLAVFFLCIYVIHGVFIYGTDPADRNP